MISKIKLSNRNLHDLHFLIQLSLNLALMDSEKVNFFSVLLMICLYLLKIVTITLRTQKHQLHRIKKENNKLKNRNNRKNSHLFHNHQIHL